MIRVTLLGTGGSAGVPLIGGADGHFQRAAHRTHAWLDRVLDWAARVGARRTVLTHMGTDLDWAWLSRHLPVGMEAGFDGQNLDCPSQ